MRGTENGTQSTAAVETVGSFHNVLGQLSSRKLLHVLDITNIFKCVNVLSEEVSKKYTNKN